MTTITPDNAKALHKYETQYSRIQTRICELFSGTQCSSYTKLRDAQADVEILNRIFYRNHPGLVTQFKQIALKISMKAVYSKGQS